MFDDRSQNISRNTKTKMRGRHVIDVCLDSARAADALLASLSIIGSLASLAICAHLVCVCVCALRHVPQLFFH